MTQDEVYNIISVSLQFNSFQWGAKCKNDVTHLLWFHFYIFDDCIVLKKWNRFKIIITEWVQHSKLKEKINGYHNGNA